MIARKRHLVEGADQRLLRSTPLRSRRARTTTCVATVVAILGIGGVDYLAGVHLSFVAIYILPVVAVTLLVSTRCGYAASTLAAATWVVSDRVQQIHVELLAIGWNGVSRGATFALAVLLIGSLRSAVDRAEAAERASREFLAGAAHQLRTPIAGLALSAEALAMEQDAATRVQLTENLVHTTQRVGRLLSGLLQLARLGRVERRAMQSTDLGVLSRAVVDAAVARGEVAVQFSTDGRTVATIDPGGFAEALANVVDNAVQRSHSCVEVVVKGRQERIEIWVRDDGPGVPSGQEDAIFESFVRLDDMGGVGLGLPIARSILRASGGDLRLLGGTFVLTVPVSEVPALEHAEATEGPGRDPRPAAGVGTG